MRDVKEELTKPTNSIEHWGQGFLEKGRRIYHPYTRKDFVFDCKRNK